MRLDDVQVEVRGEVTVRQAGDVEARDKRPDDGAALERRLLAGVGVTGLDEHDLGGPARAASVSGSPTATR